MTKRDNYVYNDGEEARDQLCEKEWDNLRIFIKRESTSFPLENEGYKNDMVRVLLKNQLLHDEIKKIVARGGG